jgi:hypothetical protein
MAKALKGVAGQQGEEGGGNEEDGDELDADDVEVVGQSANEHADTVDERWVKPGQCGELGQSLVDEVVADMDTAPVNARVFRREMDSFPGKLKGCKCNPWTRVIGVPGDECDALAIGFAAFEVHASVGLRGVLAEGGIENDERLNEGDPVGMVDGAQALEAN